MKFSISNPIHNFIGVVLISGIEIKTKFFSPATDTLRYIKAYGVSLTAVKTHTHTSIAPHTNIRLLFDSFEMKTHSIGKRKRKQISVQIE